MREIRATLWLPLEITFVHLPSLSRNFLLRRRCNMLPTHTLQRHVRLCDGAISRNLHISARRHVKCLVLFHRVRYEPPSLADLRRTKRGSTPVAVQQVKFLGSPRRLASAATIDGSSSSSTGLLSDPSCAFFLPRTRTAARPSWRHGP